jgi:hypothetical protein
MKTTLRFLALLGIMSSGIILLGASPEPKGLFGCAPEVTINKPSNGQNVPANPVSIGCPLLRNAPRANWINS